MLMAMKMIVIMMIIIIIIQFFIYLRAELNSQWPIAESATRQYRTKQTTKETTKQRQMDQLRLFTLRYDLLKISAFAVETHLAEGGATERVKVTYVPSRNTNADCFQDRGAVFSATKDIY
jgi:hypothetical protein